MNCYRKITCTVLALLVLGALLFLLTPTALGDIIITIDGGKIVGKIIKEDEFYVTIKTKYGNVQEIAREDIEKIIRGKTYKEQYNEKMKSLRPGDIDGMYEIAMWCKENTLRDEYVELIKQILEFLPDHSGARREWKDIRLGVPPEIRKRYDREEEQGAEKTVKPKTAPRPASKGPEKAEKVEPLDKDKKKQLEDLIDQYFEASDRASRDAIIQKIKPLEPVPEKDVKKYLKDFFKRLRKGPRIKGNGTQTLESDKYPGQFIITVPANMRREVPLLIGLHGGGQGVGDGANSAQKWGGAASALGAITVFPTVVQKTSTAWNTEREECYVMELISQIKRSFPVDTDRIYLCGHSMGGYGTWAIGGRYADMFAAIAPCAGGIFTMGKDAVAPGYAANLKNTPVYFYHGADDPQVPPGPDRIAAKALEELKKEYGPYEFVYKEYNGIGHGLPPDGLMPIIKWLGKHKRDPYPETVIWEPTRAYKNMFYWLKTNASRTRIVAKREGNTFTVEGVSSGFTIFANDDMIDPSKPVIVKSGTTELFNGFVQPSVSALLESVVEKEDRKQYYFYRIDL